MDWNPPRYSRSTGVIVPGRGGIPPRPGTPCRGTTVTTHSNERRL